MMKQTVWTLAALIIIAGAAFAQESAENNVANSTPTVTQPSEPAPAEQPAAQQPAPTEQAAPQASSSDHPTLPLWTDGAPAKLKTDTRDWPNLTIYLPPPATANGAAVVICPGGGYGNLAMDHEGYQVAQWLNSLGIAGFILQYRHAPDYHQPIPKVDATRAMRLVRSKAAEFKIDPNKIGIMGFSAGGHLASTIGTHFDGGIPTAEDPVEQMSCRPDFMILCYPVITFHNDYTHLGSRQNLLGDDPDPKLIEFYSNEDQIQPFTPPTFLVHSTDDTAVPVENSIKFFEGLNYQGISAEMHIYQYGGHGFGLAPNDPVLHSWTKRCEDWMRHRGLLKK